LVLAEESSEEFNAPSGDGSKVFGGSVERGISDGEGFFGFLDRPRRLSADKPEGGLKGESEGFKVDSGLWLEFFLRLVSPQEAIPKT
jgi:hypothetical protein